MEFDENKNEELITNTNKEIGTIKNEHSVLREHNEHHEHHHSHHHSHHSKHKGRRSDSAIKRFFKKNSSAVKGAVVMFLFLLTVIIVVGFIENNVGKEAGGEKTNFDKGTNGGEILFDDSSIYIGVPILNNEFFLVDKSVVNFINSDEIIPLTSIVEITEEKSFDVSYPVKLSFDTSNITNGYSLEKTSLEISENTNFEDTVFVELDDEQNVAIYNLKTGTEYYYRFSVYLSGGNKMDYCGTFKTAETPRIITVDGIRNVRDIGWWKTEDGKAIKQGLLYRGTELDAAVMPEYKLSKKGAETMTSVFGIKTDMDLRSFEDSVQGTYILGVNVEHIYYNMVMYGAIESDEGKEKVKSVFSDLAKLYKYPIYLHCTYGCDRTGTVCCILEALLGVSEKNIIKEYGLSGLTNPMLSHDNIEIVIDILKTYEGENLSKKTENYLLSTGVTAEEIASIKEIFLSEG